MLGIALAALLATADVPDAPLAALPDGGGRNAPDWSGKEALKGAGVLALSDAVVFFAGWGLLAATRRPSQEPFDLGIDPTAAAVAMIGLATLPPTLALWLTSGEAHSGGAILLTAAAQGAAIGLILVGMALHAGAGRDALLAAAMAAHFVGIPLALGFFPARGATGGTAMGETPTLSLSLAW